MAIDLTLNLAVLVFVVGSMAGMGLGLTIPEIRDPLRDLRLVAMALGLSFVAAPALALLISVVLGLEEALSTGLLLIASAAGAPFLPKLVQVAKGDVGAAVGLMVLLMVVSIVFLPLALPLLLTGVVVDSWAIARSLILMMLLPLALGLFARARYGEAVEGLKAIFAQASNIALLVLLGLGLVLNFDEMIALVGSRGLIAAALLIGGLALAGLVPGGPVLGLATGQRNISAAIVVAAQNFGGEVVTYILVASLIGMILLFPLAGELGRRSG